ncbi:hypothetical protein [Hyphococcus sp.]|uniref:hypothetical protein n=1 Tax=Hyphococcus sp. TaxID=2038636 RepID=UPI003CCB7CD7
MADEKKWTPQDADAIRALIRATVMNAGPIDPSIVPSKVRERIEGRVTGDVDIDAYIQQVLEEQNKKG